jgi:hypothetical protein
LDFHSVMKLVWVNRFSYRAFLYCLCKKR